MIARDKPSVDMPDEARQGIVDVLVVMTGKKDSYYASMTNRRILEEYDRLMESSRGN